MGYVVHLMNAGTRLINSTVSLTYFIGVNYNCVDFSSKFWPNNLGTGDSFCVKELVKCKI